jgi:uncharacterized OB-fold protein
LRDLPHLPELNAVADTSTAYRKPLPVIDAWNRPFWEACKQHRLVMQRDRQTGRFFYPPAPVSPFGASSEWDWTELSGFGSVHSWVVFHQKYYAGFAEELPYAVVLVKLDEGPQLMSNLVGVPNEAMRIGQRVRVTFRDVDERISIPVFEPVED